MGEFWVKKIPQINLNHEEAMHNNLCGFESNWKKNRFHDVRVPPEIKLWIKPLNKDAITKIKHYFALSNLSKYLDWILFAEDIKNGSF